MAVEKAGPRRVLDALKRVTTSGRFIPQVDGLRFFAIASVVLFHLQAWLVLRSGSPYARGSSQTLLGQVLAHGDWGVRFFFMISGFVLALPFAEHRLKGGKPVRLKAYFLRRLTRLEPPYIFVMVGLFLVLVLLGPVSGGPKPTPGALAPHLLASLAYLHNLVFGQMSAINPVAWSLEVEVQFYVLVPLITSVFLLPARPRRALLVTLVAVLPWLQNAFVDPNGPGTRFLSYHLQYFLVGFVLCDLFVTDWSARPKTRWQYDLLGAAALVGGAALLIANNAWTQAGMPVLAGAVGAAAFRGAWFSRLFSAPALTAIGGMCYTMYLIHFQVIAVFGRIAAKLGVPGGYVPNFLLFAALVSVPVLLATVGLYLLIERPCMDRDWPAKLAARFRPRRPVPVALALVSLEPETAAFEPALEPAEVPAAS